MRRVAALIACLTLAGCATPPRVEVPYVAPDPARFQSWLASGRMAVAAHGEGGSGSFEWRQVGDVSTLSLSGPLGAGAMRVTITGDDPSVVDGDGRELDPEATRAFLRQRLGTDLPWGELRYWMLGLPAPQSASSVSDGPGDPQRVIEQSGWRVAYSAYESAGGASLPTRFAAAAEGVKLKVMVDRWGAAAADGSAR
jgi:outer membrane lipoprotein LolB